MNSSHAMKHGINELADLVDIEFDTVLRHIFDDDFNDFNVYRMSLVKNEVTEIYVHGNAALDEITKKVGVIYMNLTREI